MTQFVCDEMTCYMGSDEVKVFFHSILLINFVVQLTKIMQKPHYY